MVSGNVRQVKEHIAAVCRRIHRNPEEIILVGVTKYADAAQVKEAVDAGIAVIGENKVQSAQEKFPLLETMGVKVSKHLIGHLQTNKAKFAVKLFDLIQSVDSLKLAEEIDKQAAKIGRVMEILVQINTSGEEQKFGADKGEGLKLVEAISQLKHLRILGLMTMAAHTENQDIIRQCFKDLRLICEELKQKFTGRDNVRMQYLSMGMSGDFEIALEEGANMVRIGSAIFK